MNLTELIVLSQELDGPQKIRVMVAKTTGAHAERFYCEEHSVITEDRIIWSQLNFPHCPWCKCQLEDYLPSYTTSLDAIMPLVLQFKTEQEMSNYLNALNDQFDPMGELGWQAEFYCATATPLQICIAFLVAKNP